MPLFLSTARELMVFMTQSADHVTGATGLAAGLTITLSKNGGAFAAITPAVTERGTGWYALSLTTTHTNTAGDFVLHITAAATDPTDFRDEVVVAIPDVNVVSITGGVVATIADAVWDEAIAGHLAAGSTGATLNAAGDPWVTALPGAYGAGTAGNIVGNRLDVAVSTRLATAGYTAPDNAGIANIFARTDVATSTRAVPGDQMALTVVAVDGIWDEVMEGAVTARQSMRLANSANGGKTDSFVPGTPGTGNLRDLGDTKNRVAATYDVNGNRTVVVRDLT